MPLGFVAGFLIMLFPKPISAKTRARLSLARIVSDLGDLYGSEISGFELEIDHKEDELDVRGRQERYRGQFLKIFVGPLQSSYNTAHCQVTLATSTQYRPQRSFLAMRMRLIK